MPSTVPTHFVDQFGTNVRLLAQRKGSKLSETVQIKSLNGNECTFEQLGSIESVEITSRNADTVISDQEHVRRWVGSRDFSVGKLHDWTDDYRAIVPLTSAYVKSQAYAIARRKDDLIVEAFTADAKSDRTGSTTISWSPSPYTGSNHATDQLYVDHNYDVMGKLASTGTGMSIIKIAAAKRILEMRNVDQDQPWYIAMTPQQEQDLILDPNLTTSDRMAWKAYQNGEMPSFYGFQFVKTTALVLGSHGFRECYAYTKNAMGMALGKDVTVEMDRRADKNHSLQIVSYFAANASRLDETEMVQLRCEETPATS